MCSARLPSLAGFHAILDIAGPKEMAPPRGKGAWNRLGRWVAALIGSPAQSARPRGVFMGCMGAKGYSADPNGRLMTPPESIVFMVD
jgi:hypothetical protein